MGTTEGDERFNREQDTEQDTGEQVLPDGPFVNTGGEDDPTQPENATEDATEDDGAEPAGENA